MQGGLGLPEREYYLVGRRRRWRTPATKYQAYVAQLLQARRLSRPAGRGAAAIIDLETKIAQAHATARGERGLRQRRAGLDPRRAREEGARASTGARCSTPPSSAARRSSTPIIRGAIPKLAALVGSEPLRRWKDWLAFHTLNQQANVLPKAFRDASFAFNGTALSGTPQQRPRDKQALNATSNALQDAVGKAYVDKYFPASAKAEIQEHGRRTSRRPSPSASRRSTGWRRRPSRKR